MSQPGAELRMSFNQGRLTVAAQDASLDRVLDAVAAWGGFAIKRSGSRYRAPLVTGRKTGDLDQILAWLLSAQNYVLFYEVRAGDGTLRPDRLSHVLLMNPPDREPIVAARTAVATRRADAPGGRDVAQRAGGDPREADGAAAGRRTLVALAPGADPSRAPGSQNQGGGVPTAASDRLSPSGNNLSDIVIDARAANIVRVVNLGGDAPLATHVMAHKAAGQSLQRTNLGSWVPWDGHTESLIDNRFAPANGGVVFDVVKGDLSDEFFPMTFTIAYRTESGLKFGSFQVMPDQRLSM